MLPVSIGHDDSVIFGAKVALSTLADCGAAPPNMRANTKRTNKRNGFDCGMITYEVYGVDSAVNNVENTWRQPRFCGQTSENHGRAWDLL